MLFVGIVRDKHIFRPFERHGTEYQNTRALGPAENTGSLAVGLHFEKGRQQEEYFTALVGVVLLDNSPLSSCARRTRETH